MDEKEIIRKYISVENIYLPVLSNKEFLNFLSRFHALLPLEPVDQSPDANPAGPRHAPALWIDADHIQLLESLLLKLSDYSIEPRTYSETSSLQETDQKRTILLKALCERVSRAITLPLESEQEAGERLFPVIQSYRKTHLKPRNQKTEEITALLMDLEKPEYASAIETLRIRTHIDELRRQNETYIALLHQRDEESTRRYMKERSADLRTTLTDLYKEMRDYAFASNLLHETDESRLFLSSLNTLIEDVRTNYKRRGPRKPKKEKEPLDETEKQG